MTARHLRSFGWLAWSLSAALGASTVQTALRVPVTADAKLNGEAAFVAQLLQKEGAVYFRLPAEALPSRDAKGQWRPEPLQAALNSQGPLALRGDVDAASKGLDVQTEAVEGEDEGRWLFAAGLPKVTLLEDSSTVSPLSKGLSAWHWPFKTVSFASVEADPKAVLSTGSSDLVVFSSPGWWDDFANPPGGPSRMPKKVAEALRDFVRQGGTALFVDIAQWDLEKAWPKTVSLNPLGPYQVSKLKLEAGPSGGVSLAPVGVATDKLRTAGAFGLLGSDKFMYPDGEARDLKAAYAMPDPGGGQGWVAGLALHVFEQDEALAGRVRRLFLNILLLSGTRRLATQGEPKVPTPPVASPTRTPRRSPTPSPTASDLPTEGPSPTFSPTLVPTAVPTAVPTEAPTAAPTPRPTARPSPAKAATPVPTRAPSPKAVPTPVPTKRNTAAPLPPLVPTLAPLKVVAARPTATAVPPTALPTARPTQRPAPLPSPRPTPKVRHTPQAAQAPTVLPTDEPTRVRPVADLEDSVKNALGCLSSAPEPFGEGGVYLTFCLKRRARVQISVYDSKGRPLWQSSASSLEAGVHKVFYDGRANSRYLVPGRYLWEVNAQYGSGLAESLQSAMSRRRESHRP